MYSTYTYIHIYIDHLHTSLFNEQNQYASARALMKASHSYESEIAKLLRFCCYVYTNIHIYIYMRALTRLLSAKPTDLFNILQVDIKARIA